MPRKEILDRIQRYVHPFRITKARDAALRTSTSGTPAA
jgi:hypothetical protein